MTGYLDSSHMVSQYLFIHSQALEARIKDIMGKDEIGYFMTPV